MNNIEPTEQQQKFIDFIALMVGDELHYWPRKSGKTTARKLLCERIMTDDES